MLRYLIAFIFIALPAFAQTDSGLIPNNTYLGNTSGARGPARPVPAPSNGVTSIDGATGAFTLGATLSRSSQQLNVATGTSGATIPLLNGNNTYSGTTTFSNLLNCLGGLFTNSGGVLSCMTSAWTGIYYPKNYGAVCNGSADDAAGINAAVAAAQAAGGGIIQMPAGYCVSQSKITIPQIAFGLTKITIQGTGLYSSWLVAKGTFTGSCLLETKGSILVKDMSFNNGGEIGVSGVSIDGFCNTATVTNGGVDHAILDKTVFLGFGQSGNKCIYNGGTGTTATTTVLNSTFNLCWFAYYSDRWNVGAVIQNNHMFNVVSGMYFGRGSGGTYGHTEGLQIIGNEVISGRDPGGTTTLRPLEFDGVCYDCHVTGNILDAEPVGPNTCPTLSKAVRIRGSATTSFTQNWLAKGLLADAAGSSYPYNNQLRIINNTFPGCSIYITAMYGGSIANNSFFLSAAPTQMLSIINSNFFTVIGNTMQDSAGLAVGGSIGNCVIAANVVSYTSASSPCTGGLNNGGGLP